jgi:hypothetical protein
LLFNYCCRAALSEADPRRRRALLVASRAHLEREPLPPPREPSSSAQANTNDAADDDSTADLVDVKYVEDVQALKAVGAALHTYRAPGDSYACVAVLGLSGLLRPPAPPKSAGLDASTTPDARGGGGGGSGHAARDREVTRALALLSDAAEAQGCSLVVADDAPSGSAAAMAAAAAAGGGGGGTSPVFGGGYGGGGESPTPLPPWAAPGAPAAGYWAQRWFPVTLSLSPTADGKFEMRAVAGAASSGAGGGGGHSGNATAAALPPALARARVTYAVSPQSGEVVVTDVEV